MLKDPDALPGQSPATDLSQIREAARTKKALLQVQQLERKVEKEKQQEQAPPEPAQPRLQPPPAKTLDIEQLLQYWRDVPAELHARLTGYLYRLWPIIHRDPAYIDKMPEPPKDPREILRQWGTGEYELRLTDLDKGLGRGQVCMARWKFSESYADAPPIIDNIRESLDMGRKENQSFIAWAQNTGRLNMTPPQNTAAPNNDAAVGALATGFRELLTELRTKRDQGTGVEGTLNKIGELYAGANKQVLDMALNQIKGNSMGDFMDLMLNYQKLVGSGNGKSGDDPRITLFLEEMKSLRAELLEERKRGDRLMERLLDSREKNNETSGLTQQILQRAVERLLDGDAPRSRPHSTWAEVLEIAKPEIGKALDVLSLFGRGFAARSTGTAPPPRPPMPAQPQPSPTAGLSAAEPPDSASAAPEAPNSQEAVMREQLIKFLQSHWLTILKFIQEDRPGQEMADYLMFGGQLNPMQLGVLRDVVGKDLIMSTIRATPEAWAEIQPITLQFEKLLEGFLQWHEGWDEDSAQDAQPPQPASNGAIPS